MPDSATHRVFAALFLPDDTTAALTEALATGCAQLHFPAAATEPGLTLRWTPAHQWHITLGFFPACTAEQIHALDAGLARLAASTPSLQFNLRGAGVFNQRVLYAEVQPSEPVRWQQLHEQIRALAPATEAPASANAATANSATVGQAFHPHLTLARGKDAALLHEAAQALETLTLGPVQSCDISLIRSELNQHGPQYTELGCYRWGQASS